MNVFLNNKLLKQSENLKYLGIIIDKKFNFDNHVETITQNCTKLVHSLAKSARISWGLNHEVMRIIYKGAILPLISYGAPIWIDAIKKKHNAAKLKRVQRLVLIRVTKAFRTTSYEALCILTRTMPITLELDKLLPFEKGNTKMSNNGHP